MDKLEYIPGDFTTWLGRKVRIDGVIVTPDTKQIDYYEIADTGSESVFQGKSLKPIKLTCAILKKNGWKKDKDGYFNDSYHIRLCKSNTNYAAYKVVNNSIVWLRAVENVPDLQHLLFGLDISLKIEV